ncbi:hypothetical protein [Streptomyces neyagawaensis]|uniref:hypothetical protein n=1 Tax=Streptomyces neyagawaensis TaxID=42238 RepID=UPI0006E18111|nr:hypothetical protein [Streptomyces neyagawaensis]MCL6734179.1 hypothetical protein [Streptomyces neyagawaensis]MDE1681113.1 hypothetical protein [Streptomyces neyagawaensis]
MRGPRRPAATMGALLTALLTGFGLVLLGAPPSAAGGPTSVLLASPTSQRTASLYGTDKAYVRLHELMDPAASGSGGGRGEPPMSEEEMAEAPTDMINVTWMIHDVSPWRVDQVYPTLPDTKDVWIHTTVSVGAMGTDANEERGGAWHKAKDSQELRQVLTWLGVLGTEPDGTRSDGPGRSELPSLGSSAGARADSGAATADGTRAGKPGLADQARWAIPALVLGLALGSTVTVLLRRAAARREAGGPGPRQQLLDA